MTTATVTQPNAVTTTPVLSQARRILIAAPLILGGLAVAVVLVMVPWGERNELSYEALAPLRDAAWAGIVVDALGIAAVGVCLALVVAQLVPGRGAVWANVGGVLTAAGGVLFAMGMYSFGSLAWYATDPAAISPSGGAALLDHAVANPQHGMLLQIVGFLAFTLGTLLLSVALLRAGTVTRWLPIGVIVLTVALFVAPGRVQDLAQAAQLLVLAGIGAAYLRSAAAKVG